MDSGESAAKHGQQWLTLSFARTDLLAPGQGLLVMCFLSAVDQAVVADVERHFGVLPARLGEMVASFRPVAIPKSATVVIASEPEVV